MNKKTQYLNDSAIMAEPRLSFMEQDDRNYSISDAAVKSGQIMAPIPIDWDFLSDEDRRQIILRFFAKGIREMVYIFEGIQSPTKSQDLFDILLDYLINSERNSLIDNDRIINKMLSLSSEFIFGARVKKELMLRLVQSGFLEEDSEKVS